MIRRRDVLKSALLLATVPARQILAAQPAAADASQFSYAVLKGRARALAAAAYKPPEKLAPDNLQRLDYDQYQAIRFRPDHALWAQEDLGFRVQFFHMGRGFKEPVRMYELVDGRER